MLKKQIYVDDELLQDIHIKQYNETFLNKLYKDFCCPVKNGYYVFTIYGDHEVEAIEVENNYLKAWGKGKIENNQVVNFMNEFEFDTNQKITRKFLSILGKTSYKLISAEAEN